MNPLRKNASPGRDLRQQATRSWLFAAATRPERFWESQENCCRCLDHRFGEDEFVPVAGTGAKHRRASSTAQQKMSALYVCGNLKYYLSNLFCLAAGICSRTSKSVRQPSTGWH